MLEQRMGRIMFYIEFIMAGLLLVITALTVGGVILEVWHSFVETAPALEPVSRAQFTLIISHVLEVFIVIELFRIAIAYMTHKNVIPTVLEAALVAVARKFVVYEPIGSVWLPAIGLAALLLAVAGAWWMLARTGACDSCEIHQD